MDEPVPYTAVVERDPQPGQLIFQFIADDPDTNSEIMYTLHSKSPNTSRLIMKDGKILTESGPPFKYDTYKILVSACDVKAVNRYGSTNNKSQEIFAELIIHVGKRAPQFYQSEYKINISESAPIGYLVANMRAKSFNPDPFNKKHLRYSLLTKQNKQSDEFSIYSENGTVILARKVDYETDKREYNLIVTVSEQSGWLFSSSTRLNIYIEDANDNPPQFTLSEYVKNVQVPEDIPFDTFIISVEVQDRDSGPNSEIEWSVSNTNFYVKPFSANDTKRAKIYNKGRLDYEIPQHVYRFDVIACDKGKEPLCANAKVSVPMSNVNDEKPRFDMKVITSILDENVPPGTFVTTITATDDDGDRVFFSLKDETSPFEINRESGIVKIKNDRRIDAKQDYYNLTVFADDDGSCCCHNGNKQKSVINYASNCNVKTNREEAILVIKINDINDHAPKFIDCDSYSRLAQVEEEMPIGTNVTQVIAYDEDKGQNGEVEYEIISTNHNNEKNSPFKIDHNTGVIRTNMIFDRESNGKLNEISITVKAKDKGTPHPLSDACSFRIKIIDINDHAPIFYEPEYKLSIKYGLLPGQNIQRIIANDFDMGKNAEIRYMIDQSGPHAQYFHVDEMTGMISLKKEIPSNIRLPISFNLIAQDQGEPSKSTSVKVSAYFADRDNEPPKWLPETEKRFERVVRIPEAISLNQVVETLDAESNYAPNSKLIFDFSPKPNPESFIIQQERIPGTNRYRGKIIVYQPLDAETKNFYELHVRVQNAAAQPMEIIGVVRVEILDSNDNMPLFTSNSYLANVTENAPPGTYVTKVTAEDKDISAPNNVVVYSINDPDHSKKFQIDPYTGNITTRVVLDREEIKYYFIDVTACDSAMSDRPNMNTPNCGVASVRIDVADTNDNTPFFNESLYYAEVLESAERGTPIITIQAFDGDENSQMRYIITDGNEDNVFAVREQIGEIYVANNGKLDFETLDEYLLTLTVSDSLHNATTKVRISLIDVNDNPPIFTESPPYEIELVEEDLNYPRVILKINATDGDIKRPNTIVYKINYNYTQNGTLFRPFSINANTGEIILQEKLDRDYPNGRPVWSFNVIASDEGGGKGSMDSTAVVNVRLIDINDNAPVFDKPPYIGHIMENSKVGTPIMTISATDYDDPNMSQNAILRYQIAENKKFGNIDIFSINETTGQISQNVMLDREQIDKYTIEVCATDGGGKRGCGQVTIYVDDANDQAPVFQSLTPYTEEIREDLPIGERVITITAIDKDQGVNAELSYSLRSECMIRNERYTGDDSQDCIGGFKEPKYFKIDTERVANSGFVKLAKSVNYDPPDYHRVFKLNVSVSDGIHQSFTVVYINIIDVNDEAPQFHEPVKNIRILESIDPFTIITNFSAFDLDTNELFRKFTFSMDRKSDGSHKFTIDQNGNLYNLEPLDRETKDKYILRVFATDEGYPPQTGIATLNLDLIDVNDNFPIFAEDYKPVIMENSSPGQFVAKVRAKDLDDPENGPPFKFSLPDHLTVWPSKKEYSRFNISFHYDDKNGENVVELYTLTKFDRESKDCKSRMLSAKNLELLSVSERNYELENQCKEWKIPIIIADSGNPAMSGTNYLSVFIGDLNDNEHYPGEKTIIVYDYKGSITKKRDDQIYIGNVYAEDKDDWDANDKIFTLNPRTNDNIKKYFEVIDSIEYQTNLDIRIPGSIYIKPGLKQGSYKLYVDVKDKTRPQYEAQLGEVNIVIKTIHEEAVENSGSIRLSGISSEKLVETRYSSDGKSYIDEIQFYLAKDIFKLQKEDSLEIFSVINHKKLSNTVDIRYTIVTPPYHKSLRLNGILAHSRNQFQRKLTSIDSSIKLVSVGIDECADSEKRCKDEGCTSYTKYSINPHVVNTNKSSLVGISASEHAECSCRSIQHFKKSLNNPCDDKNYCLNGGICSRDSAVFKCKCPPGFDGPRCQRTLYNFNSSGGYAWLPSIPQCQNFILSLEFVTTNPKGLLFYNGPIITDKEEKPKTYRRSQDDYIALQLNNGKLQFTIKHGMNIKEKVVTIDNFNKTLNDGRWHRIDIFKTGYKYRLTIDRCVDEGISKQGMFQGCESEIILEIHDIFININRNYPLQVGGIYDRQALPTNFDYKGYFVGCMRNMQFNGEYFDFQINTPNTLGLSLNGGEKCPRADRLCNPHNETDFCLNGFCDADFESYQCVCKPGYRGRNCEIQAQPFDFQANGINKHHGSYLKYRYVYKSDYRDSAYDAYLKKFTKIQLLLRTRENTTDRVQTLFQITSSNRNQFIYLEIADNRLQFRYDFGSGENLVRLTYHQINDGKWHFVRAERFGKEVLLTLDEGEGTQMNYSSGLPNGFREMDIDRDSIFIGAKVVQIKVSGFEVSRDYHDSCMLDVRFDDKPLPFTKLEEEMYEDIAIKMEHINVNSGCSSIDYCKGIFCSSNKKCVDLWRLGECQCPKGKKFNGTRCEDTNECRLCSPDGTKYCERLDTNQVITTFDHYHLNNEIESNHLGEYPPKYWFYTQTSNKIEYSYLNDETHEDDYKCVCRPGYYGSYCNAQASTVQSMVFLSFEALIIMLSCLVLLLSKFNIK